MIEQKTLDKLKAPFLPAQHKDCVLPDGGKWLFIPWQLIRNRVEEACPSWSVSYSDPVVVGDLVVIRCTLTIEGVSREGVGSDKDYREGKTIERATADAFKNAAEQFGVGTYLNHPDNVIRIMQQGGDGRANAYTDRRQEFLNRKPRLQALDPNQQPLKIGKR